MARSVPMIRTMPATTSRSPGLASSSSEASFFKLSASLLAAPASEAPPQVIELEPPLAARNQVDVALDHTHALGRHTEGIRNDLGIRRVMALPARLRTHQHGNAAVFFEPRRRGSGPLLPQASI